MRRQQLRTAILGVSLTLGLLGVGSGVSSADAIYDFSGNGSSYGNVSSQNKTTDGKTGSQYTVQVTDAGNGQVAFTFQNNGPAQSTIANIYFADGPFLMNPPTITVTGDTTWSGSSNPGSLPSAPKTFVTTEEYDSQSTNPKPTDGVDWMPGDPDNGIDSVTLTFKLLSGKTFADVINALSDTNGPSGTPSLQIGIHVINFADGGSESFINNPTAHPSIVPEPSAMALALIGVAGLGFISLRRLRRPTSVLGAWYSLRPNDPGSVSFKS